MSEESVIIQLDRERRVYRPGETLAGSYRLVDSERALRSIELSILWFTEGKGDEDLGVHFFDQLTSSEDFPIDPRETRRFSTRLPQSPLSYEGIILKIRWCVRVRGYDTDGKELLSETPFQLGEVAPAQEMATK